MAHIASSATEAFHMYADVIHDTVEKTKTELVQWGFSPDQASQMAMKLQQTWTLKIDQASVVSKPEGAQSQAAAAPGGGQMQNAPPAGGQYYTDVMTAVHSLPNPYEIGAPQAQSTYETLSQLRAKEQRDEARKQAAARQAAEDEQKAAAGGGGVPTSQLPPPPGSSSSSSSSLGKRKPLDVDALPADRKRVRYSLMRSGPLYRKAGAAGTPVNAAYGSGVAPPPIVGAGGVPAPAAVAAASSSSSSSSVGAPPPPPPPPGGAAPLVPGVVNGYPHQLAALQPSSAAGAGESGASQSAIRFHTESPSATEIAPTHGASEQAVATALQDELTLEKDLDRESLCSDDDDSEDEPELDPVDIILAQYTKVHRQNDRWTVTLKDGIIHINNRDFVFHAAEGRLHWGD